MLDLPEEIDNNQLMQRDGSLKPGLYDTYDYQVIPSNESEIGR